MRCSQYFFNDTFLIFDPPMRGKVCISHRSLIQNALQSVSN